jgi:predicted metal-binding membrane protein
MPTAEAGAPAPDPLLGLLHRDRWIVLGGLTTLTISAAVESQRAGEAMMQASPLARWGPAEMAAVAMMWAVMMVAMMTPIASPMVLTFAGLERQRLGRKGSPWGNTSAFLGGYLLVWIGFSAIVTIAQWGLYSAAMLSACGMKLMSPAAGGALMTSAGLFQFSTAKSACLKHCRTPVGFLLSEWRDGRSGALMMGVRHGLYCAGCCWLLMLLLFVTGVMNAAWCAALAALVLAERILPGGLWLARAAGIILVACGGGLAAGIW